MRATPSLPQRGRQHAGSIPLTPSFLKSIFFNLLMSYRNKEDAQVAGAEARWAKSPQERLIVSMRVSTEPYFFIFLRVCAA
jgi:hypothetical protein